MRLTMANNRNGARVRSRRAPPLAANQGLSTTLSMGRGATTSPFTVRGAVHSSIQVRTNCSGSLLPAMLVISRPKLQAPSEGLAVPPVHWLRSGSSTTAMSRIISPESASMVIGHSVPSGKVRARDSTEWN